MIGFRCWFSNTGDDCSQNNTLVTRRDFTVVAYLFCLAACTFLPMFASGSAPIFALFQKTHTCCGRLPPTGAPSVYATNCVRAATSGSQGYRPPRTLHPLPTLRPPPAAGTPGRLTPDGFAANYARNVLPILPPTLGSQSLLGRDEVFQRTRVGVARKRFAHFGQRLAVIVGQRAAALKCSCMFYRLR